MNQKAFQTIAYCLVLLLIACLINACGTGGPSKPTGAELEIIKAQNLIEKGQYDDAANIYWELSKTSKSPKKEQYQLRSAELLVESGNFTLAQQHLNSINERSLSVELIPRKRIAQATISIEDGKYSETLNLLPESLISHAANERASILELRAQAFSGLGDISSSLKTRFELSSILANPEAADQNQTKIWSDLTNASNEDLIKLSNIDDAEFAGWISLAQTMHTPYANKEQLSYALDQWSLEYPDHPATDTLINSILESYQNYLVIPDKIALLLPMTGNFAKIAEVIYAGILSARTLKNDSQYEPDLALYDTGNNPEDINYHYDLAVSEGSDFVIGPLQKEAVEILAERPVLPIPVLTLNYLSQGLSAPSNMFQFGLLPEDEAKQVAERSSLDEYHHAIVFAPIGEWGSRLVSAFESRFTELNGLVINTQYYSAKETDFSVPLKLALHLDESEERYRNLRSLLGQNLEFEPRRRQDVDMIFLVASPRVARLMRPQINYYYATDLPVYSTSHVFSGVESITQDRDLEGVIYLDIPWILEPSNEQELLAELLELEAGDSYELLPRFAALGVDAYYLPEKLAELSALSNERYDGLTGKLSIQDKNKVYRQLNWAIFRNGRPIIIPQYTLDSTTQQ